MPLRFFAAIFAASVFGMSVGGAYWVWRHEFVEEREAIEEMAELEQTSLPKPDPGLGRYEYAMAQIRQGDLMGGRDTLLDLVRVYNDSSRYAEAKRVIGEINMDLLLSSDLTLGKREYVVQRGDSMLAIVGRNSCTLDYLMRVNNLFNTTLQPGQRMIVMPLEFEVIIHLGEGTLTLMRKEKFFKEYALTGHKIPPVAAGVRETTVKGRSTWADGRQIRFPDRLYHGSVKWIQFASPGLIITGTPEGMLADGELEDEDEVEGEVGGGTDSAEPTADEVGIFLDPADVEELFTILPFNTKVTIIR